MARAPERDGEPGSIFSSGHRRAVYMNGVGLRTTDVRRIPRLLLARARSLVESLRGSYWFWPMVMALMAGVGAVVMVRVDHAVPASVIRSFPWSGAAEPEGARAVLSVVAGSMITVTGVVFSIVVVALALASSQFGPRLLRNFLRDRTNQMAFGTFVATFFYGLIVLRSVRADETLQIATAFAVALATVSVFVLIYFIHHIATSIQASSVIADVAHEIEAHVPELFPATIGEAKLSAASADVVLERLAADGTVISAPANGFIRVIDDAAVMSVAKNHDLAVALHRKPGDFVAAGTALARVGPTERVTDEVLSALTDSFVFGDRRTPVQDLGFLINQLTDIAVRALSPGVNDPRTAIDCIHRLGAVICAIADREMPSGARSDDEGKLRVIAPHATFEAIVALCVDPLRRYGGGQVAIVTALLDALAGVAECCPDPRRREVLAEHAREIHAGFFAGDARSPRDRAEARLAMERAMRQLGVERTDPTVLSAPWSSSGGRSASS